MTEAATFELVVADLHDHARFHRDPIEAPPRRPTALHARHPHLSFAAEALLDANRLELAQELDPVVVREP